VLGGAPVRTAAFPSWPVQDGREEQALVSVLKSGRWGRGNGDRVKAFETQYATATGAAHCLATANGTSALLTTVNALGIGPGDEVIVPPYTFVATINVVLARHALPVFVDTDIETFQIDAKKIAGAITDRTRLIMPVHLGGSVADMDTIMATAAARGIDVLEDACQSHLAQWKGRHVGSIGTAGCFSFQASKNLNSGEGGAVITSDRELFEKAYAFQNNGRSREGSGVADGAAALNLRLTEFQGALLLAQMTRLEAQSKQRESNAAYLTQQLAQIPGITPAKMYAGVTRNAYHLYMFRYSSEGFAGMSRAAFLKALRPRGCPPVLGTRPSTRKRSSPTRSPRRGISASTVRPPSIGGASATARPRTIGSARRRSGSPRRCSSGRERTWTTSSRRCGRSRSTRATSPASPTSGARGRRECRRRRVPGRLVPSCRRHAGAR
jgi:dTDP-4-amino-4,6-dideoxygalactose transaminase